MDDSIEQDSKVSFGDVHRENFIVRIHEINQDQCLTIPALLRLMQETSMQHIIKLKASVWDLAEQKLSWVLLRKKVNILSEVRMGERISIVTYPTGFEKFFAYRDFLVFNEEKKLVATASSMWSLINTESRKIARVPDHFSQFEVGQDVRRLTRPDGKLPRPPLTAVGKRTIRHYDLDWNGHINNTILCRFMVETLLEAGVREEDLRELNFQFKNECNLGSEVDLQIDTEHKSVAVMFGDRLICRLHTSE